MQSLKAKKLLIYCCIPATRGHEVRLILLSTLVIHSLTLCGHLLVKVYLEWKLSWPKSLMKSCCIAA
jgi:hypothetical protein